MRRSSSGNGADLMGKPVIVKSFVSEPPRYSRPQMEAFEWLAAAHAQAALTRTGREDRSGVLQERIMDLLLRYSCAPEHIGSRRSDIPDFMHTDWQRMTIFNLQESPRGQGLRIRNAFYAGTADRVVEALFSRDTQPPSDLIHVSCTGYVSPSPVQRLIERKGWNRSTRAVQVYHMGCYAALPALRIAAGLADYVGARAEIVHTELCTLHFNPADHSPVQLIIQTLFADGHIRYAVVPDEARNDDDGAFEIVALQEEVVPDSLDDMTWTVSEWGFQMTLSRDVPGKIADALPRFLVELFSKAEMKYSDEADEAVFAIHPGGPRILDSVQELLGLKEIQLRLSRTILFERGNMSSATLPHIWMAAAADASVKPGSIIVSLAFGPGLTIAGAIFRKC